MFLKWLKNCNDKALLLKTAKICALASWRQSQILPNKSKRDPPETFKLNRTHSNTKGQSRSKLSAAMFILTKYEHTTQFWKILFERKLHRFLRRQRKVYLSWTTMNNWRIRLSKHYRFKNTNTLGQKTISEMQFRLKFHCCTETKTFEEYISRSPNSDWYQWSFTCWKIKNKKIFAHTWLSKFGLEWAELFITFVCTGFQRKISTCHKQLF